MSSGKPETLKPEALTLNPKPGFCCMGLSFWGSFGKPPGAFREFEVWRSRVQG